MKKKQETANWRLRHARELRCWSQAELAEAVGTTDVNVSRWERGVSYPGPHFRQKLCAVFAVDPFALGLVGAEHPSGGPMHQESVEDADVWHRAAAVAEPPFDEVLLPPPVRLIGREPMLTWVLDRLRRGSCVTAITGMGGIGKTTLATVAVRQARREGHFRDGIAVVICQDLTSPLDVLKQALARFDIQRRQPQASDLADLAEAARRLLHGRDALIVLDNVEPSLILDHIIQPIHEAGATLLLTARHMVPHTAIAIQDVCRLDLLCADEALDLFWHAYGREPTEVTPDQRSAAARIVAALGRHTLAVKLAGMYAADVRPDLATLARELESDPLDIPQGEIPRALALAFHRSITALPVASGEIFTMLGACATADCGRHAILTVGSALGLHYPKAALDTLILRALVDCHLADDVPEDEDRERIRMHPLMQALARERFSAWSAERRDAVHGALARYFAEYVQGGEERDLARARDHGNIAAALEWAHAHDEYALVSALCTGMSQYWRDRRLPGDCLRYMPWGAAAAETVARATGTRVDMLRAAEFARVYAHALRMLGQHDQAMAVLRDHVAVCRELADHYGQSQILHALGLAALADGHLDAASEYLHGSLAVLAEHPQLLIHDWRVYAIAYTVLAACARCRAAIEMLDDFCVAGLELAQARADEKWEAALLFTRAQIALLYGRLDDARAGYRSLIVAGVRHNERRGTAVVWLQLGRAELAAHRLAEAERCLRASIEPLQAANDQLNLAYSRCLLAQVAYQRGQRAFARTELRQISHLQSQSGDTSGEAESLSCLGQIAEDEGELDAAEHAYRASLECYQAARNYPGIASALLALGRLLVEQFARREEGSRLLREAVERYAEMGLPGEQEARDILRRASRSA